MSVIHETQPVWRFRTYINNYLEERKNKIAEEENKKNENKLLALNKAESEMIVSMIGKRKGNYLIGEIKKLKRIIGDEITVLKAGDNIVININSLSKTEETNRKEFESIINNIVGTSEKVSAIIKADGINEEDRIYLMRIGFENRGEYLEKAVEPGILQTISTVEKLETEGEKLGIQDYRFTLKGILKGVDYEIFSFWKITGIHTTIFGKKIEINSFIEEHSNATMGQKIAVWVIRALSIGLGGIAGWFAFGINPFMAILGIPTLFITQQILHFLYNYLQVKKNRKNYMLLSENQSSQFRAPITKKQAEEVRKNGQLIEQESFFTVESEGNDFFYFSIDSDGLKFKIHNDKQADNKFFDRSVLSQIPNLVDIYLEDDFGMMEKINIKFDIKEKEDGSVDFIVAPINYYGKGNIKIRIVPKNNSKIEPYIPPDKDKVKNTKTEYPLSNIEKREDSIEAGGYQAIYMEDYFHIKNGKPDETELEELKNKLKKLMRGGGFVLKFSRKAINTEEYSISYLSYLYSSIERDIVAFSDCLAATLIGLGYEFLYRDEENKKEKLSFFISESIKNSFVHGNYQNLNLPIYITVINDELRIFNKIQNKTEYVNQYGTSLRELKRNSFAAAGILHGFGLGIDMSESLFEYYFSGALGKYYAFSLHRKESNVGEGLPTQTGLMLETTVNKVKRAMNINLKALFMVIIELLKTMIAVFKKKFDEFILEHFGNNIVDDTEKEEILRRGKDVQLLYNLSYEIMKKNNLEQEFHPALINFLALLVNACNNMGKKTDWQVLLKSVSEIKYTNTQAEMFMEILKLYKENLVKEKGILSKKDLIVLLIIDIIINKYEQLTNNFQDLISGIVKAINKTMTNFDFDKDIFSMEEYEKISKQVLDNYSSTTETEFVSEFRMVGNVFDLVLNRLEKILFIKAIMELIKSGTNVPGKKHVLLVYSDSEQEESELRKELKNKGIENVEMVTLKIKYEMENNIRGGMYIDVDKGIRAKYDEDNKKIIVYSKKGIDNKSPEEIYELLIQEFFTEQNKDTYFIHFVNLTNGVKQIDITQVLQSLDKYSGSFIMPHNVMNILSAA